MRSPIFLLLLSVPFSALRAQDIVTDDLAYFWEAYDAIRQEPDTNAHLPLFQELLQDRGTPGLKAIQQARRYTAEDYVAAIRNYPAYWESIRRNEARALAYIPEIAAGLQRFRQLYPDGASAAIYFEPGVFRTPGTAVDGVVVIGAELSFADTATVCWELPASMDYVRAYAQQNPIDGLVFLAVHEYVHTQQSAAYAYDLLSQSLFEGIPEFLASLSTGQASVQPAFAYGALHREEVLARFAEEMHNPFYYHWLYNSSDNEFGVRDLGYFVGYTLAEAYYEKQKDKTKAIKALVELDFESPAAVAALVEATGVFPEPLSVYQAAFDARRPVVEAVEGLGDNLESVPYGKAAMAVRFSEPMDRRFWSTGYGEAGESAFPAITALTFSEDGRTMVYEMDLEPGKAYDFVINSGYRTADLRPLQPKVVRFKTQPR